MSERSANALVAVQGFTKTLGSSSVASYWSVLYSARRKRFQRYGKGFGMEVAADLSLVVESHRIDHQRVAIPMADRFSHPCWIGIR